ncbi:MAG: DUF368 domain-containing protein [Planctomycetota bacterium]
MNSQETKPSDESHDVPEKSSTGDTSGNSTLIVRSVFGGILMGLANLVPGISGGTMLLAAGIYPRFIDSVAEVTRFKFKFRSLLVLGCVVVSAVVAIGLLAGMLKDLVVENRWIMYSLFIGLTLGGVPVVWKLTRKASPGLIAGGIAAFAAMVALAVLQASGYIGGGGSNFVTLFIAGLAGASAMILPGLSGGYLLLLLGQYVPILTAIENFKNALESRDIGAAMDPALTVVLPVGIGVVVGVAVVGNLLQWLFKRYRQVTLGILLGLLLGSVVGLWPFQQTLQPEVGDTINKTGQVVTAENINDFDPEDWNTEYFQPEATQIAGSLGLIVLGFGITMGVAMIGGGKEESDEAETPSE